MGHDRKVGLEFVGGAMLRLAALPGMRGYDLVFCPSPRKILLKSARIIMYHRSQLKIPGIQRLNDRVLEANWEAKGIPAKEGSRQNSDGTPITALPTTTPVVKGEIWAC